MGCVPHTLMHSEQLRHPNFSFSDSASLVELQTHYHSMSLLPETLLGFCEPTWFYPFEEKYVMLEQLGVGCFATVNKCVEKQSGRIYAVKQHRLELMQARDIENLKREIQFQKTLDHKNIVKCVDVVFWQGVWQR